MKFAYILSSIIFFVLIPHQSGIGQNKKLISDAREAMLNATTYMVDDVSTNGGYVALYLSDLSRQWGELEAYKTQIWVQSPGTVSMGELFLDAYNVTKNEYYYDAAEKVAEALIWGQLPSGGWNYLIDFAGDRSLKEWYNTIGKNAWGFEEYNHYYGNATFDDTTSSDAAKFLLRIYLRKLDFKFKPALDKTISFFIESQYPLGGWPQRYPLQYDFPHGELEDYSSFYTFNDDVIWGNIDFLIECYLTLGEERFLDPIRRGMNFYLITQQGNPQGGWGQQYNMKLEPAHARTYEPPALLPGRTYTNAMLLLRFYEYTGDSKFIARVPDAIKWLKSTQLPKDKTKEGNYTHSTFIEMGTNKSIFAHRKGTDVANGHYWWDYNDENLLAHYGGKTNVNIKRLEEEYERLKNLSSKEIKKNALLKAQSYKGDITPQRYYDSNSSTETPNEAEVKAIINSLDDKNRWLVKNPQISRPYSISEKGKEVNTAKLSDENGRAIRDTSNQKYISTEDYEKKMRLLINYLK